MSIGRQGALGHPWQFVAQSDSRSPEVLVAIAFRAAVLSIHPPTVHRKNSFPKPDRDQKYVP